MRFFVMGGTGFIGHALLEHLRDQSHSVSALVHPGFQLKIDGVEEVEGDALGGGSWQEQLAGADVVINLVGSSILGRWTKHAKKLILETRIESTKRAIEGMSAAGKATLLCANAVGYYGDRADEVLTEDSKVGEGFLSEVCIAWQKAALEAERAGHRVVVLRFAPVLGRGGGVLGQMLPVFRRGMGGRLGNGRQWFSWVHMMDLPRAMELVAKDERAEGPVNVCSPRPVRNAELTSLLSKAVGRAAIARVPAFVLRLVYGEAADTLLFSQRCSPTKLETLGFEFAYPGLERALADLVERDTGRAKPEVCPP